MNSDCINSFHVTPVAPSSGFAGFTVVLNECFSN